MTLWGARTRILPAFFISNSTHRTGFHCRRQHRKGRGRNMDTITGSLVCTKSIVVVLRVWISRPSVSLRCLLMRKVSWIGRLYGESLFSMWFQVKVMCLPRFHRRACPTSSSVAPLVLTFPEAVHTQARWIIKKVPTGSTRTSEKSSIKGEPSGNFPINNLLTNRITSSSFHSHPTTFLWKVIISLNMHRSVAREEACHGQDPLKMYLSFSAIETLHSLRFPS